MKRRILALLLVLLMVVSILPAPTFAADTEEPRYAKLNDSVTEFTVQDRENGGLTSPFWDEDLEEGTIFRIVDSYEDGAKLWYRVEFYVGGVIGKFAGGWPDEPWILQNDGTGVNTLVFVECCEYCGEPDCGTDHTPSGDEPLSGTVTDANGNSQTVTVSGGSIPEGTSMQVECVETASSGNGFVTDISYDISLVRDGVEYEPGIPVTVTITGLEVCDYSFVKVTHYLEDVSAIAVGVENGTVQVWVDEELAQKYPAAAAAALEATGEAGAVCVEQFYSSEGDVTVEDGKISFVASSFSIYTVTSTGTADGRAYCVYDDDNGTAQNSNGYSETHEITMDDSNGMTYMLTRGQKFYLDIGPNFFIAGMTSYQWYLSDSAVGSLDKSGFGTLAGNDTILTVAGSAPHYTKYTITVVGYNLWGNEKDRRTINVYIVPEVQLIFNANIPDGAQNNVSVPTSRKTVLGDGSSSVLYTRVNVGNISGSVTGYTFDGWYTAATGGTMVSSGTYLFLDNDNASYIGGTYSDQYQEILYAHWKANEYTLNFNANGGSVSPTSKTVSYNGVYGDLPTPTRTGYSPTGWFTAASGGTKVTKDTVHKTTGNTTVYAQWTPNVYKVTLNNQSATTAGTTAYWYQYNTVKNGNYYYSNSACTTGLKNGYYITVPTKTGYTFGGYYTGTNGSGKQYVDANGMCVNNLYSSVYEDTTLYAKWMPVQYTVTWIVDGKTTTEQYAYGATPSFKGSTDKQADAQYTYTFTGWSPAISAVTGSVTYTAQYSKKVNQYTVTFVDYDGTVLKAAAKYDYGTAADKIAKPADPTREGNGQFTYTFTGWSPSLSPVTKNVTYTAQYAETALQYTVTWIVDGKTTTEKYDYNTMPSYKGSTDKKADAQYTYTFTGWSPNLSKVTGDVTYTAQYTGTVNQYTVTWVLGDRVETELYDYGAIPSYKGDVSRPEDAQYKYTFAGWSSELVKVTGDATYTAKYRTTDQCYKITFRAWDGKIIDTEEYKYGTKAENIFTPQTSRPETERYTYEFIGWAPLLEDVTRAIEYHANFREVEKECTITYAASEGGTVSLTTETVKVGTGVPQGSTAAADTGWKFVGWYQDDVKVSEELFFRPARETNGIFKAAAYEARFERALVDLTVTASGLTAGENTVFTVTGTPFDKAYGTITVDVVLCPENNFTVTVKDIPVGEYTVSGLSGWCWRYDAVTDQTVTVMANTTTLFAYVKNTQKIYWLNGYQEDKKRGGLR